jgi:hypothetical protein
MDTNTTIGERCFLCGPCREVITRKVGAMSSVEFCTGGCEDRTWAREAEESPLLKAVARERLVNTRQTRKCLADVVVIYKVWRLTIEL